MGAIPPELREALATYFARIFYQIIMGILRAKSLETDFAELKVRIRRLTEQQVKKLAQYASEYYVEHINPSSQNDQQAIHSLKAKALNHGLKRLSDEESSDNGA